MQFHCLDCPVSYCFDCWPTDKQMVNYKPPISFVNNFIRRGYDLSKNILFYRCAECEEVKGKFVPVEATVAVGQKEFKSPFLSNVTPVKPVTPDVVSKVSAIVTVSKLSPVHTNDNSNGVIDLTDGPPRPLPIVGSNLMKLLKDRVFCEQILENRVAAVPMQLNDRTMETNKSNLCIRLKDLAEMIWSHPSFDRSVVVYPNLLPSLLAGFKKHPSFMNVVYIDPVVCWKGKIGPKGYVMMVELQYSYPLHCQLNVDILLSHLKYFDAQEFSNCMNMVSFNKKKKGKNSNAQA